MKYENQADLSKQWHFSQNPPSAILKWPKIVITTQQWLEIIN